jgi:hypothetical protein
LGLSDLLADFRHDVVMRYCLAALDVLEAFRYLLDKPLFIVQVTINRLLDYSVAGPAQRFGDTVRAP